VSNPLKILVTGATGAVGPCVVQLLCDEGYKVRTLSLNASKQNLLPDEVEKQLGDITCFDDVKKAVDGCDVVIHLAALLHIIDPPVHIQPKYEQVNVAGTENLVKAAIQFGVKRFVYFSTINVYGSTANQIVDETYLPNPDSFYALTKLAGEKIVLGARNTESKPIGVVLRLGAVYGTRIKGNYSRLLHSLANGQFVTVGDGSNRRTLVYDKDVAYASLLAMKHPEALGKIFNVTDGTFHTVSEIVETMCLALGRRPPLVSLPIAPVRLVVGILEDAGKFVRLHSPITRSTIDKYTEDIAVNGMCIQHELGFTPTYSLKQGWREVVTEMHHLGKL
jgi:nucleoside-diphosphate-sugar epimerase